MTVDIIQVNLKMVLKMEKEYYITKMEALNIKVILLMINLKAKENIFIKMVDIIKVNLNQE